MKPGIKQLFCGLIAMTTSPEYTPTQNEGINSPVVKVEYTIPYNDLRAASKISGQSLTELIDETITIVEKRFGNDAKVVKSDTYDFTIYNMSELERHEIRKYVEIKGNLETRVIASDDYVNKKGEKVFDLKSERERLLKWLNSGGRSVLEMRLSDISAFNQHGTEGPLARGRLEWVPRIITPNERRPQLWRRSYCKPQSKIVSACVPLYENEEYNRGLIPENFLDMPLEEQRLVELIAVNTLEKPSLTNEDINKEYLTKLDKGITFIDETGKYSTWTTTATGHLAFLVDGEITGVKMIEHIAKVGIIPIEKEGREIEAILRALQQKPLQILPEKKTK